MLEHPSVLYVAAVSCFIIFNHNSATALFTTYYISVVFYISDGSHVQLNYKRKRDRGHKYLVRCAFGSVMTLGLPLNSISLWILLRLHSIKSPSAIYMVNLAISHLLLVVMRIYFYATGNWPLIAQACIWITMLSHNSIRSSSIFITFICVDRLLALVYPLRS